MRPYTSRMKPPFTMIGSSVAEVEESKHPNFPVGATIVIMAGWVERGIVDPDKMNKDSPGGTLGGVMPAPDLPGGLSKSLLIGSCGMPGNTAYFGLLKGCNVVGFAGSDEKCSWLKSIGFDHAFNYKKTDVTESLAKAAPKGVDCYFDNVGGEMSVAVLNAMNTRGRAAICGAISHYNEVGGYSKTTDILPLCIFKELMVEGFLVGRWAGPRWVEGIKAMAGWVAAGDIKVKETTVEGFARMPQALMGLFTGENTGKMLVKA